MVWPAKDIINGVKIMQKANRSSVSCIWRGSTFLIILLCLCTISFSPFTYAGDVSSPKGALPKILTPNPEFNFGVVVQGETLTHEFPVENNGSSDLIIRKLNPSCGCTAAVLKDAVIPPGGKSSIRVSFDTTGFVGKKSKTVRVYSNDPLNSSIVLFVNAEIIAEVFADPIRLDFNNIRRGTEETKHFYIRSAEGKNTQFKEAISKSEYFTVSSKEISPSEVEVSVSLLGKAPIGKTRTRVLVRTANPKVPVINVPLVADVVGDILLEPKSINFGYIEGALNTKTQRTLEVLRAEGLDPSIKITKVSANHKSISAELVEGDKTSTQFIRVTLLPGVDGVIRASVIAELNHTDPLERKIEIPLYAVVDNKVR